jgi:hypothetical protein
MGASRLKKLIDYEELQRVQMAKEHKKQAKARQKRQDLPEPMQGVTSSSLAFSTPELRAKRKREQEKQQFIEFFKHISTTMNQQQQQQQQSAAASTTNATNLPPQKKQRLTDIKQSVQNQSIRLSAPPQSPGAEKMFVSSLANPTKIQRINPPQPASVSATKAAPATTTTTTAAAPSVANKPVPVKSSSASSAKPPQVPAQKEKTYPAIPVPAKPTASPSSAKTVKKTPAPPQK